MQELRAALDAEATLDPARTKLQRTVATSGEGLQEALTYLCDNMEPFSTGMCR